MLPPEHYGYYKAFYTLNACIESRFGNELLPCFEKCIEDFEKAYMDLGLTVTPKVHLLVEHATEDISKHGYGLAIFNESAAESIHADFDAFYQRYAVKDITSDSYINKLQSAVTAYNSNHLWIWLLILF